MALGFKNKKTDGLIPVEEEKKEIRKIVSIAGPRADELVYITAKLLGHGTLPILIVDNTPDHILFRAVGHEKEEDAVYEKNLTVVKNAAFTDRLLESFNFVVVYHGIYPDKTWWDHSDLMFIITDFERFPMEDLGQRLRGMTLNNVGLILKGRYLEKIHDTLIPEVLGLPEEALEIAEEIPADERAEAVRLMFQYDGTLKLQTLPKEIKEAAYAMYKLTAEPDKKEKMASVFSEAD